MTDADMSKATAPSADERQFIEDIILGHETRRSENYLDVRIKHALAEVREAAASEQAELLAALRRRAIVKRIVPLGGGEAVDGFQCNECGAYWKGDDPAWQHYIAERHEDNCILARAALAKAEERNV